MVAEMSATGAEGAAFQYNSFKPERSPFSMFSDLSQCESKTVYPKNNQK